VFDDVFIPNERIFINGETEFAGKQLCYSLFITVTAIVDANPVWGMSLWEPCR
jgi:aromatic ring hydroxylase